jgi:uncharacterized protein YbbK (DUF523 family)
MQAYCDTRPSGLSQLCGFVFKSRSPSCGLDSTPVFIDGTCITETSRGLFARAITTALPDMPVIEETGLESPGNYERFVSRIFRFREQITRA